MTAETKIKSVAAGFTGILFVSLLGTGILYRDNSLLSENINAEKARTERLEGERNALREDMDKLAQELANFKSKNGALNLVIQDAQQKLEQQQTRLAQLTKDKAGLDQLKKENAAMRKLKQDLAAQLEGIQSDKGQLQLEIAELNRTIAMLRHENNKLLAKANTKAIMAYNFRTEVVKRKKERLTVKANRTHHINISFDINHTGELPGTLYAKVKSPENKEVAGELLVIENVVTETALLTASMDKGWLTAPEYRSVTLTFDPTEKLSQGIYHIMIYSGNDYLGSTQFKLAK